MSIASYRLDDDTVSMWLLFVSQCQEKSSWCKIYKTECCTEALFNPSRNQPGCVRKNLKSVFKELITAFSVKVINLIKNKNFPYCGFLVLKNFEPRI